MNLEEDEDNDNEEESIIISKILDKYNA